MCGICGYVESGSASAEPDRIQRMADALAHRGPDDSGLWTDGPAGLGHRRLSVLDLSSAGHQPMHSEDGRCVLSYNGELYNFLELRAELEALGHTFHSRCDTEVVLRALMQWGADALRRFNGIYAFAFYDRDRESLLLARDRLGVKPLFYTLRGGALAFASELSALGAGGFLPAAINPAALDAFLTFLYIPAPDTIYEDVFKLRPGEYLLWERGQCTLERYWRPIYAIDPAWTLDSAAERFLELLRDAVRLQRVSDVPLGAFLSGGVDSSAVIATLSESSDRPPKTFTVGFNDAEADELAFARLAATHCGADHTELILAPPDAVAMLETLVHHFGEPFADSSALPTALISEAARRHVTVALSGDGGDELFAGYSWTHWNHRAAAYRRFPRTLRSLIDTALRLAPNGPLVNKVRRFSADGFLSPDASFKRRLSTFTPEMRSALYTPEADQAIQCAAIGRFEEHCAEAAALPPDDRMLYLDTVQYLPDDALTKVDRMSMLHALEVRVPLLDHRIVEFAATVPFPLKYHCGESKRLMKRALHPLLPPELLRQRKRGFSIPIHRWFREGPLRGHAESLLQDPNARLYRWLRPEPIRRLLKEHAAAAENYGHPLWALIILETWLRKMKLS